MTDLETGILTLFANDTATLSVKEIYTLLYPIHGHGIHQVRKTLKKLDQHGILFCEVRNHGLYLYRHIDPVKDKWWISRTKEICVYDKALQNYAQRLFKK